MNCHQILSKLFVSFVSLLLLNACSEESTVEAIDTPAAPVKEINFPTYREYYYKGEVYEDWETGEWQSGFKKEEGPVASFSIEGNENSAVVQWSPDPDEAYDARIHSLEVVELDDSKVLKVWSDGTKRVPKGEWNPDIPYSNRAEISWSKFIPLAPEEEMYVTYQYKPGESWKEVHKYHTIITQFKEFGSGPFFVVNISNAGLNANNNLDLKVKGGVPEGKTARIIPETKIGEIGMENWTTVKIYIKASTEESEGVIKLWLNGGDNGKPTFTYEGRTLLIGGNSYPKFGHYGSIFNSKVSYFDNLHITKKISTSLDVWAIADAELE